MSAADATQVDPEVQAGEFIQRYLELRRQLLPQFEELIDPIGEILQAESVEPKTDEMLRDVLDQLVRICERGTETVLEQFQQDRRQLNV